MTIEYKGEYGEINDIRCKANSIKMIDKNTCKNNCKYYDNLNKKCLLNYGYKLKR